MRLYESKRRFIHTWLLNALYLLLFLIAIFIRRSSFDDFLLSESLKGGGSRAGYGVFQQRAFDNISRADDVYSVGAWGMEWGWVDSRARRSLHSLAAPAAWQWLDGPVRTTLFSLGAATTSTVTPTCVDMRAPRRPDPTPRSRASLDPPTCRRSPIASYNLLAGPVRILQDRVKPGSCTLSSSLPAEYVDVRTGVGARLGARAVARAVEATLTLHPQPDPRRSVLLRLVLDLHPAHGGVQSRELLAGGSREPHERVRTQSPGQLAGKGSCYPPPTPIPPDSCSCPPQPSMGSTMMKTCATHDSRAPGLSRTSI